jgi:hypothetical protein
VGAVQDQGGDRDALAFCDEVFLGPGAHLFADQTVCLLVDSERPVELACMLPRTRPVDEVDAPRQQAVLALFVAVPVTPCEPEPPIEVVSEPAPALVAEGIVPFLSDARSAHVHESVSAIGVSKDVLERQGGTPGMTSDDPSVEVERSADGVEILDVTRNRKGLLAIGGTAAPSLVPSDDRHEIFERVGEVVEVVP